MSKQVCYGDIVYINVDKLVMFSPGFYDPLVYMVGTENLSLTNFRNCLFQIYPNFSYKDSGQIDQLKNQLYLLKQLNPDNKIGAAQLTNDLDNEKRTIDLRQEKLEHLNEKIFNESKNKPVCYGQKVQLFHLESQSFVAISKEFNKQDKSLLNLNLTKEGSKALYFEFRPVLSLIEEGDPIEYGTQIKLVGYVKELTLKLGSRIATENLKIELNPESNEFTRSDEQFAKVQQRRGELLYENKEIFSVGAKATDNIENLTLIQYAPFSKWDEANTKKFLKTGDFLRISDEKQFLTIYPWEDQDAHTYFQNFSSEQQKMSTLYTLFQILEIQDDQSILPLMKYVDNDPTTVMRKYGVKHFVTGKYLYNNGGKLGLKSANTVNDIPKVNVFSKPKGKGKDLTIDKNSIVQINFLEENASVEYETFKQNSTSKSLLTKRGQRKIPNVQYDLNTLWYFGFKMQENYLNKWLRPERSESIITGDLNDSATHFRITNLLDEEIAAINFVESFANQTQKFVDFLYRFYKNDDIKFRTFNREVLWFTRKCKEFLKNVFVEPWEEEMSVEGLTPDKLKQVLLKDFRVFDLLYRTLFYLIRDEDYRGKIDKRIKAAAEAIATQREEEEQFDISLDQASENKGDQKINFGQLADLFSTIQQIIKAGFIKNENNHFYCNQYVRVAIHCLVNSSLGLFGLAPSGPKQITCESMLELCKEALSDSDLDSLGQLNYYIDDTFDVIRTQDSYISEYLGLLEHISRSKAPNLNNQIRDRFILEFLSEEENLKHVFPMIQQEGGDITFKFTRRNKPELNATLSLSKLNEKEIEKAGRKAFEEEREAVLTRYLLGALRLAAALALKGSKTFSLKIVKHYRYEDLNKILAALSSTSNPHLRIVISDILAKVHQDYFKITFPKLPPQIQILDDTGVMKPILDDIQKVITKSFDTAISVYENKFIKENNLETFINQLKSVAIAREEHEILNLIEKKPSLHEAGEVRIIIEGIQKIADSGADIPVSFLSQANNILVYFIKEATNAKNPDLFHFIEKALGVYGKLNVKLIEFAATDIIQTLKQQRIFGLKSEDITNSGSDLLTLSKKIIQDESPKKNKSRIKLQIQAPLLASVIAVQTMEWKSGEKYMIKPAVQLNSASVLPAESAVLQKYEQAGTKQLLSTLFDILVINEDQLTSQVLIQLKRIASFEGLLYKELDKLVLIFDQGILKKTATLIEATSRLNEITREITFCNENSINIPENDLKPLLNEILNTFWDIFFILYEPSKHFKTPDLEKDPKLRYKQIFTELKKGSTNIFWRINPNGLNKMFQKILRVLGTQKAVLSTLEWVLAKKTSGFTEALETHTLIIRLSLSILKSFVYKNKENQMALSDNDTFIKLLYNQHFINQGSDVLLVFSEMMRENRKLCRLPMKYLYDITCYTFLGTLSRVINDSESNSYLSSALASLHYLSMASVPQELFNTKPTFQKYWSYLSKPEDFNSLNILKKTENLISLPYCYYSIRELMLQTVAIIEQQYSSDPKSLAEAQQWIVFETLANILESPNFILQFQLKSLLTTCVRLIYFDQELKGNLTQDFGECQRLISLLCYDIIHFRQFISQKKGRAPKRLQEIIESENFISGHEKFVLMKNNFAENQVDMRVTKLRIDFDDITIEDLMREYIYDGCINLLCAILRQETAYCKKIIDPKHPKIQCLLDFSLEILDDLIENDDGEEKFPYLKLEELLNGLSVEKTYATFKEKIIQITNKLHTKLKLKGLSLHDLKPKDGITFTTGLDNYNNHIDHLLSKKKNIKEQNLEDIALTLTEYPEKRKVIKNLVNYLNKDIEKLDKDEALFILRLLRIIITRENSKAEGKPIFLWEDVNILDLKKMLGTQILYKDAGLTEVIFTFLASNNDALFKESIMLSIAYLYGGNDEVQQAFFENFLRDDENAIIQEISKRWQKLWEKFRRRETIKLDYVYSTVQKNLFEYMGTKEDEKEIDDSQILIAAERDIPQKYFDNALEHPDNLNFIILLQFLQSLCEGQFNKMQNFLRIQKYNDISLPRSFDFLNDLRHIFNGYYKFLTKYNLSIGNKILDLIIELIQGEVKENISSLLHKTFIYDMCRILTDYNKRYHTLPRGFGLNSNHYQFREFKGSVIFCFKVLLENKDPQNLATLAEHLDVEGLLHILETSVKSFMKQKNIDRYKDADDFIFDHDLTNEDFNGPLGDAINIYIIFRYIWEDNEEFTEKVRGLIQKHHQNKAKKQDFLEHIIFLLLKRLVSSIELIDESRDISLMRIWFPVIASCHYLHDDTKEAFLTNVDRSNTQTKLVGLVDAVNEFIPQMEAEFTSRNRILGLNLGNFYYFFRFITNILGVVIAIINLMTYSYNQSTQEATQYPGFSNAVLSLNIVQTALASTIAVLWVFLLRKRHVSLMWERLVDSNTKEQGFLRPSIVRKLDEGLYDDLSQEECLQVMNLKGANSEEFKVIMNKPEKFKLIKSQYYLKVVLFSLTAGSFIWHLIYVGICIGSIFHPVAQIFQIFDIAIRSDTVKQISESVSRNVRQFLWTFFLLLATNAVYSQIGFFFMNSFFSNGEGTYFCQDSIECFLFVLNYGLRAGGGVGDAIQKEEYNSEDPGPYIARVFYNLTFWMFMIILLLNLIFGMIIDAFGNLRDQKASDDEDRKNRCFICGIDRSEYERHANFEDHVTEEHNVWAYVYYLTYVLEKYKNDKNSLTDLENHVVEKFQTKNYGWFPNKSLTLEKCYEKEKIQKDSEEESLAQKIDALRNEMKSQMTIIQAKLPSGKPLAARQQKVKAKPLEEKKEVE